MGLAKSTINEGCYGSVISGSISVSFWQKKPWYPFFTVLVFPYKKMSIALHIRFVENDQTYYFASNHTPGGQHCYVR